jgi:hypothetical protein
LEIIDLYASEYKWTSNYILENVYIDEFFIQRDIITQRKREHYKMLSLISLLPNRDEKGIKEFFNVLDGQNGDSSIVDEPIETDFDAILRAKEQIAKMT